MFSRKKCYFWNLQLLFALIAFVVNLESHLNRFFSKFAGFISLMRGYPMVWGYPTFQFNPMLTNKSFRNSNNKVLCLISPANEGFHIYLEIRQTFRGDLKLSIFYPLKSNLKVIKLWGNSTH